jgi:hypothetical protein
LLIEVGPGAVTFVIRSNDDHFSTILVYNFAPDLTVKLLAEQLNELLNEQKFINYPFKNITIVWAFPEAILAPYEFMRSPAEMLNLVFGDLQHSAVKTDLIAKHNIHVVYRIPSLIADVLSKHVALATQMHKYSVLQDIGGGSNQLYLIFYNYWFTVMIHKEQKLQAIQSFQYKNPDDVAYHLINICAAFDLSLEDSKLEYSGMIDSASGLFDAIYKYFPTVEPQVLPESATYNEAISNYPPHFFSHYFATALCG